MAVGLAMLVGVVGIVVPVLPGLFLVWAASGAWALVVRDWAGWVVWGMTTSLYAAGLVLQYLIPGRRLRAIGVETKVLVLAVLAAIPGFFVIPVVGAPLFFVGAIYLVSRVRLHDHAPAWTATKGAVRAVGTSIGIELVAALAIIASWVVGVWVSR